MTTARTRTIDRDGLMRKLSLLFIAFLAMALCCLLVSKVQAAPQAGDYEVPNLGPYGDDSYVRKEESKIGIALMSREALSNEQSRAIMLYYKEYLWRKMAQPDAQPMLGQLVNETVDRLERASKGPAQSAYALAKRYVLEAAAKVALQTPAGVTVGNKTYQGDKTFSPLARVAAVTLLGRVDSRPAANGNPPVPEFQSVGPILDALIADETAPVGVRIAAFAGIHRHAMLLGPWPSAPDTLKAPYVALAKQILEDSGPVGLTSVELGSRNHGFLQRLAIDIVAAAGVDDDKKWLAGHINLLMVDAEQPSFVAMYGAEKMRELGSAIDELQVTPETVVAWGERVLASVDTEIAWLKALDRPKEVIPQRSKVKLPGDDGKRGGGGYPGGPGGMGGTDGGYGAGYGDGPGGMGGGEGGYPGGMGGDGGYPGGPGGEGGYGTPTAQPQPLEIITSRRRLNADLQALLYGFAGTLDADEPVTGLAKLAQDESQQRADELLASMRTLVDEVNQKAISTRVRYLTMLEEQREEIDKWLARHRPLEADEDAESDDADPGDVASN